MSKAGKRKTGSLSELFHENSKLNPILQQALFQRILAYGQDRDAAAGTPRASKTYPGHQQIKLPHRFGGRGAGLWPTLRQRRTRRQFKHQSLPKKTLAKLLWFSAGQTGQFEVPGKAGQFIPLRAAPSAGALNAIEIYLISFDIQKIEQGVYHYNVSDHALEQIYRKDFSAGLPDYLLAQEITGPSVAAMVLTGDTTNLLAKYGERGYRFLLIEAGHLAQNLLLMAQSLKLAAVPLGGFHDDALDDALGLADGSEISLYPILLGM